jgi:hypothetical protein
LDSIAFKKANTSAWVEVLTKFDFSGVRIRSSDHGVCAWEATVHAHSIKRKPFIRKFRVNGFKQSKFGLKQKPVSGNGKATVSVLHGMPKCNSVGMGSVKWLIYFY